MMDGAEDDSRYPPNPYGTSRQSFPVQNGTYPDNGDDQFVEDADYDNIDDDDDNNNDDDDDAVLRIGNDDYGDDVNPKKRKLSSLFSNYEFAPRVPALLAAVPKPSYGGRNRLADWTEHETFILLNAWGDRFLERGRNSLLSEEWQEVAKKVILESNIERTEPQCRNRFYSLKKTYKKEKMKLGESGQSSSKWVYFEKMDMLMSSLPQQGRLSSGVDSGEYVFMNPEVYLDRANGLDEMRDSPEKSESTGIEKGDSKGTQPESTKSKRDKDRGASFNLLVNSIEKFSEIYEKVENNKTQQIVELERMRMDFHRDLELQKRQILERTRAEIENLWR